MVHPVIKSSAFSGSEQGPAVSEVVDVLKQNKIDVDSFSLSVKQFDLIDNECRYYPFISTSQKIRDWLLVRGIFKCDFCRFIFNPKLIDVF